MNDRHMMTSVYVELEFGVPMKEWGVVGMLVSERIVRCSVEGQIIPEAEWKPFG